MSEPTPPQPAEGDSGESQVQEQAQPNATQQRINQITRQRHEAERAKGELQVQNEQLTARIMSLENKVASAPAAPAPVNDFGYSAPAPVGQVPQQANVDDLITKAVTTAMDSVRQEQSQQEFKMLQKDSFDEAAEALPNIRIPGSQEQALFDQIYASNPAFHTMENGPAIAIQLVSHALGASTTGDQAARKQVATSPQPGAPAQRLQGLPDQVSANSAAIDEMAGRVKDGWSSDEFTDYIGLKLGRANVRKQE